MPGAKGGTIKWDDALERKFLMTIIHVASPSSPNWDKIAELMGIECTPSALRQKFGKMKKAAKEELGGLSEATAGEAGEREAAPPAKNKGGKRKKKTDEDEDEEQSPKKKVKAENVDDEEV